MMSLLDYLTWSLYLLLMSGYIPVGLQQDRNTTTDTLTFQQSTSASVLPTRSVTPPTESFTERLMTQHVRLCGSNRVCVRYRPNRCWRCSPCQCDDKCQFYDDCCPDKDHAVITEPSRPSLPVSCVSNLHGSYSMEERSSRYNVSKSYFMVSSCPDNSSSAAAACSASVLHPPVTSYKDGLTFKNKFCAMCNNAEELHQWKLMVDCNFTKNFLQFNSTKSVLDFALKEAECWVVYTPPRDIDARECYKDDDMISSCNVTGRWPVFNKFLHQACHNYTTVKEVEGVKYRNVFCYMCNTEDPDLLPKCKKNNLIPAPFSALLDFGSTMKQEPHDQKRCSVSQIYFELQDSCRGVTCSRGKQLINTSCIPTLSSAKGLSYELYFDVLLEKPLNLSSTDDPLLFIAERLKEFFPYFLAGSVTYNQFVVFLNTTGQYGTCSETETKLSVYSTFVTTSHVEPLQFESSLLEFRNMTFSLPTETGDLFFQTTPNEKVRMLNDILNHGIASDTRCFTNVSLTDPLMLLPALKIDTNGQPLKNIGFIRVSNLLLCPRIYLEYNEFTFQDSHETITLIWNKTLHQEDFQEDKDGSVRICLEHFKPTSQKTPQLLQSTNVEILLSIVCSTMSLVCLLLTSVTYCLFRNLRRLPGKNNINLTINLFAAQLLYLLGSNRTDVKGVCEALGIFIHYLWLTVFCAMGICSFHMFHVFTTLRNREDAGERRRRYLQYCVFIYGVPTIFVAATLAIHIIVSQGSDIGYGGDLCYLSSNMAVGLGFALPVGVVVLVNMTFFILTVRSIRSIPRLTKSKQDEHYTIVYIKLSSLTGITWIIGFLAIIFELQVLRFMFIVINASQGVFIFMSFMCNRKILNLYLDSLRRKYSKSTVTTSVTTSSKTVLPAPTSEMAVSNGVI